MSHEHRERLYRVEAVVLKRRELGEADQVLTCYTRERGKLTLIAKGARKLTSRKAGYVELFSHATFLVARGRTWDIVTQAEGIHAFSPIRNDLLRTCYAYCVAETIDRLTEEQDENRSMFDLLVDTLERLCQPNDLRLPARYYELHLLELAGYRPELFNCLECNEPIQPTANFMSVVRGGILCSRCGMGKAGSREISLPALKVMRYMQTRKYESVECLHLRDSVHAEVEDILHLFIASILEQNLKSSGFLHLLRDQMAMSPADTPSAGALESLDNRATTGV